MVTAIKVFGDGLEVVLDDTVLIKDLSVAYGRQGDKSRALEMAAKLVKLQPDDVNTLVYYAVLLDDAGKATAAAENRMTFWR